MKNRFRVPAVSLFLAIISIFILSTCGEEIVKPEQDAIVIGSIHGVVKNATTGERLSGVTVTWVSGDSVLSVRTTTTDDLGYFLISGLTSGEYEVSFTGVEAFTEYHGEAFIPAIGDIIAEFEGDAKGVYYVATTLNSSLYELSSSYKGIVWAKVKDGTVNAASGAEVQFELSSANIAPLVYKGSTGEDGSFSLTGLPAGAYGNLKVLPYNDGTSAFSTFMSSSEKLSSGETKDAGDIVLTLASDAPFIISSNYVDADDFDVTAKPTGTFNKAINTSGTVVTLSSYDEDECTVTWMDDITFTIDPDYPFDVSSSYSVTVSGESQDGRSFNISDWFGTQDGIMLDNTNLMLSEDNPVDNFPLDGNIVLYFTQEVDLEHYNYWLSLTGGLELDVTASGDGKVITIDPVGDLAPEAYYTLTGQIYSTIPGDNVNVFQTFRTTSGVFIVPVQVTDVVHDTTYGEWPIDWKSYQFHFEWKRVAGATQYRIYAKDTYQNPDYVWFTTASDLDQNTTQEKYFSLSPQFDYFEDDGIMTPFSHGTQVSFIITARNAAGEEGPASAALTFSDELAPSDYQLFQTQSVNNTGGTADKEAKVYLSVGAPGGNGEYLSTDLPLLKLQGPKSGAGLGGASAAMEWDNDRRGGIVIITVPADSTVVGDSLIVHFKDTSENSATDTLQLFF